MFFAFKITVAILLYIYRVKELSLSAAVILAHRPSRSVTWHDIAARVTTYAEKYRTVARDYGTMARDYSTLSRKMMWAIPGTWDSLHLVIARAGGRLALFLITAKQMRKKRKVIGTLLRNLLPFFFFMHLHDVYVETYVFYPFNTGYRCISTCKNMQTRIGHNCFTWS